MSEHVDTLLNALRELDCQPKPNGSNEWSAKCPAHEDDNPSLSINVKNDVLYIHCHAGCDPKSVLAEMGLTFRHLYPNSGPGVVPTYAAQRHNNKPLKTRHRKPRDETVDWDALWVQQTFDLRQLDSDENVQRPGVLLSFNLGLPYESLILLGMGYSKIDSAFTFPMRDEYGAIVGIRIRNVEAKKWAVTGSRSGIFYPDPQLIELDPDDPIFICEGPTDTAALLSLGLFPIGRPSCSGGKDYILGLTGRMGWKNIVIVSDLDGPGVIGAVRLADVLTQFNHHVRVMPPGKGNDAREWYKDHNATRQTVLAIAESQGKWILGKSAARLEAQRQQDKEDRERDS